MANESKRYTFKDRLIDMAVAFFKENTDDVMLDVLADQEYRICLLELGIN